jgi:pilus assembly protein CpaB
VSARARRRRALLLLSLALASGGLAASEVRGRLREVDARVGSPVPVVVAARDLRAGAELGGGDLSLREVPAAFAPRDALGSPDQATGFRPSGPVPKGGYVTAGQLQGADARGRRDGSALRPGERAVEVAVAGTEGAAGAGARVDVLVSTEPRSGSGRALLALEDVELLGLRPAGADAGGGGEDGAGATASAIAILRVTLRQAVYLTAAQNYAREVRLLARPPGDRVRLGRSAVGGGEL